jgi:hypothetical protein
LTNQLEVTTANVRLEVETAVREIATTHREMHSHYHAIRGSEAEIEYLERRWRLLPGEQQVAGIVLDDLLNAQERLGRAEGSYAAALAAYNIALVQLKRAVGVLLQLQPLEAPSDVAPPAPVVVPPVISTQPTPAAPVEMRSASTARIAWPPKTSPAAEIARRPPARGVWPAPQGNSEQIRR